MKIKVSKKLIKKKDKMNVALRPNSKNKWFNRVKGISSTVGDSQPIKVNIFGVTSFSTTNSQTSLTNDMNSYPQTGATSGQTFIGVQENRLFLNKANRVKLGSSDQG